MCVCVCLLVAKANSSFRTGGTNTAVKRLMTAIHETKYCILISTSRCGKKFFFLLRYQIKCNFHFNLLLEQAINTHSHKVTKIKN